MIQLFKYFSILFTNKNISRQLLKDFTADHIARLTTNNPGGIFATILTNITNAYNSYFGDLDAEALKVRLQEGKTIAMDNTHVALTTLISKNAGLISYKYGEGSEIYEQFYPQGVTKFSEDDLPTLETDAAAYKAVLASHSADFDADFVTEYDDTFQAYKDARVAQHQAFGNVAGERNDIITTKAAVCKQLTVNLLTIAIQCIGNESKADVYFDQSMINTAFAQAESRVENEITTNETQNCFDNTASNETNYKTTVSGEGTVYVGFAETPETAIDATSGKPVDQTAPKIYSAGVLGYTPGVKKYLNITSTAGITISYVVERVTV